ncbi:hypothetical protein PPYR_13648 [Photinus pyralis]|uniref:tRNA (guanine(26)-N(2))-dimethyltransferase n=1 Tax=Photinus pyralis TaxID=7054 RepID=A0A5N4A9U8_PHOPY|nr:probable tRNA (guanine(26)-N(2))-dimethyltransferase [Photinus pyralis]KAB0794028.1 hypothetical protein PPYR_13648 [Photinus pyralis]
MLLTSRSQIRALNLNHLRQAVRSLIVTMEEKPDPSTATDQQTINEGRASIKVSGNVFYNPVQEFNRDLSISVLNVFAREHCKSDKLEAGVKHEGGIRILEALSATGLRSIRYAKEICGVSEIVANDISRNAVAAIRDNVRDNQVEELVVASENDAIMLMYEHHSKEQQFDVVDLDPYGCPSRFLDSAVQAVCDGGLLLVTATDMAVLAGNSPETCYSKYGAISLRTKCCYEMALRILLQCIESHANRYGRYIEPVLSLSADFYIRVFVKIYTGAHKCKFSTSKLSMVYQCNGCETFTLSPLGVLKTADNKQVKFKLPTGPPVNSQCEHCQHSHLLGGPIWSAPIHNPDFVQKVVTEAPVHLNTVRRIQGVLNVIFEELLDCPLYFILERLSGILHLTTPPMMEFRSAILNAGYRVSFSHSHKTSIKTDAPPKVIWDILRCWERLHPLSDKRRSEKSAGNNILAIKSEKEYSFSSHPHANPPSRREGYVRFQENPLPYWGPGTRSTTMVGDAKMQKSKRNQGKRKRTVSE